MPRRKFERDHSTDAGVMLSDGNRWFTVVFEGRRSGAIGKKVSFKARVRAAEAQDVEITIYRSGFEHVTVNSIQED